MDKESVNWCRIAQTIMQKGGEVHRQFIILEILTSSFNLYSRFWLEIVHNPAKVNYLAKLNLALATILRKSQDPSDKSLKNLLKSLESPYSVSGKPIPVMDQIVRLKQWKEHVEKEKDKSGSSSVVESWLSETEKEIGKLMSMCTITSSWNNTFHEQLKKAQSGLLLEIEKNDRFLSRCIHKLRSLSKPSSNEFQQLIQNFKTELNIWKTKCSDVFQEFFNDCRNLISLMHQIDASVPNGNVLMKFRNDFKTLIDRSDLASLVQDFIGKWYEDLHATFDNYNTNIKENVSAETILTVAQGFCEDIAKLSSFKDNKIRHFFRSFMPPQLPRYFSLHCSELQNISRSSDLEKFDLTMLMIVWRNGGFVHSPLQDWDDDLPLWDTSIGAEVGRLRVYRNNIVAHIAQLKISNEKFEELWKILSQLLRNIALRCGEKFSMNISWEIDQMKECSLEPQREYQFREEFLTWCKKDILAQLSARSTAAPQCLDMLQSIQTALEKLAKSRQAYTCRICHKDFSTENELTEHMRLHQQCRCCTCNMTFYSENELTDHMKIHQDRSCRICKMECSTEWEFRRHMWCNQDCRCRSCDEAFLTKRVFEEHVTSHQALTCRICGKGFSTESDFCQHMFDHQARTCCSCPKEFHTDNELEQHMNYHKARMCRSCNKGFSKAIELEEHMRYHEACTCHICDQEFFTDSEFAEHLRKHKDVPIPVIVPVHEPIGLSASEGVATGEMASADQSLG